MLLPNQYVLIYLKRLFREKIIEVVLKIPFFALNVSTVNVLSFEGPIVL